ncbi:MAG: pyridoxal-phosphate dependent enzyme [Actinobacteria bacterium]|nr:pyridoxal-phosphate dependent enzyme [Actinomycetota bacterium]
MIELDNLRSAARRLEDVAHRTPVLTSRTLNEAAGAQVFLKAENLQRGGAFKIRGAYNKISQLTPEELSRGIAAFSSGNHAQAVALSARLVGTKATILMPEDAPPSKLDATRAYGSEVITYDRYTQNRTELGLALSAERGLTLVHPYDDPDIIAGQGTVALELLEEVPDLDVLLVPVGGGGLISGCSIAMSAVGRPGAVIVGVEPAAGDDTKQSLAAGHRVTIEVPRTIADGQQVETPGAITFEIVQRNVDQIDLVTDAEIVGAMAFLFERMKIVVEPSGACALSALLAGHLEEIADGKKVGVILSGGNIGIERFVGLLS